MSLAEAVIIVLLAANLCVVARYRRPERFKKPPGRPFHALRVGR
jgi:hypothetical protein